MKILYYDCFAGISGDMNLGAMIDLGIDPGYLRAELLRLPLHGYELKVTTDVRKGITGTRVEVITYPDHAGSTEGAISHHSHSHNTYGQIRKMIEASSLNKNVKKISLDIFRRIAGAEAVIHNTEPDKVHFHEVGAIDSIVDIVGAAICIDKLGPDTVQCSVIELGGGFVNCAHGRYPVPAPATSELLKGIPVRTGSVDHEATTPTGAAILASVVTTFTGRTEFNILKTGYGVGMKDGVLPNVLRVFIGETTDKAQSVPESCIIECNIDDMNPEYYDHIFNLLFNAGASDVYITQIIMKKMRPAVKLSVLCSRETENSIKELLIMETSTFGVRQYPVEKTALDRHFTDVTTRFGTVRVKSAVYNGKIIKSKPEYEDCLKIAREHNIPINQVYNEVIGTGSDQGYNLKYNELLKYLTEAGSAAVAFSGGTDSTFLLFAAKKALDKKVLAMTVKTPYIPDWEVEEARNFCKDHGIEHKIINLNIAEEIKNNPADRCYICKKLVFGTLIEEAAKKGFTAVMDGTNADDTHDFRPGLKALRELDVKSPLLVSGLKKDEIRILSERFGLPTAQKPAYACLLTRLPHDTEIKTTELERIEKAELFLMSLGFRAARVRNHGMLARIEIRKEDISNFINSGAPAKVSVYFHDIGYSFVTLDVEGYRTGSFNNM
jgi:uncharacterized protein (TIGR00299 family) protein/uncharacterized protein (TIGR00268 family)